MNLREAGLPHESGKLSRRTGFPACQQLSSLSAARKGCLATKILKY